MVQFIFEQIAGFIGALLGGKHNSDAGGNHVGAMRAAIRFRSNGSRWGRGHLDLASVPATWSGDGAAFRTAVISELGAERPLRWIEKWVVNPRFVVVIVVTSQGEAELACSTETLHRLKSHNGSTS